MTIPGFVDLQVNGFRGVDFSSDRLTADDVDSVSRALLEQGVVAYCPAVVTTSREVYARALPLLAKACERQSGGARILGIHLEGPFISPQDGPRGVHPPEHVRPPSIEFFEWMRELADDRIALLTVAPEEEGAVDLIGHVAASGRTVVSLGHHAADAETIRRAVDAGARACTHVGNGLADMIHRHLNPLWPILAEDRLTGLFISDGHHLPPEFLRVALRAKGAERFIVTSDMSHLAGMAPGNYTFHGARVVLEENGRLHREGAYQLAGSASTMLPCMNVLASLGELDEDGLRRVGCRNALDLLGVADSPESLAPNAPPVRFDGERFLVG
ncbi:MAG TPA: N-acetylglucosamine-6-phosphate deacetylase [Sumerlaeia bacterium]|nr:N-acetylglucosamine-6-phosphate deacetylase [Sumerlaeia bacterium]